MFLLLNQLHIQIEKHLLQLVKNLNNKFENKNFDSQPEKKTCTRKNANCLKEKDKILLEITSSITIINRKDYIFDYPQYIKSKSHITDLIINGGKIRVFCDDLSDEVVKELNLVKSLAITLNSKIFDTWLNTEAYE